MTRRTAVTALFGVVLVAAALAPIAVAGSPATEALPPAVQSGDCDGVDGSDSLGYLADRYEYAAGLGGATAGDWTGGTVVPIGAAGDCSLAVTNGTATLTAAQVDGRRGLVEASVDLGADGAIRAVARNASGGRVARVTVANRGRPNDAALVVVVHRANGSTARTRLTAPGGRFFGLSLRFGPGDDVAIRVREPGRQFRPQAYDYTVRTGAPNATWTVELRSAAYLDDIGVGRRASATVTETPAVEPSGGTDGGEETVFPSTTPLGTPGGEAGDGVASGLLFGPVLVLCGLVTVAFPYPVARAGEIFDAVGSTRSASEVEPAGWKVVLTRLSGVLVAAVGGAWLVVSLLA